jgi:hypothetical protein
LVAGAGDPDENRASFRIGVINREAVRARRTSGNQLATVEVFGVIAANSKAGRSAGER